MFIYIERVGIFTPWGIERVTKILSKIGFKNVKAEKTLFFELNAIYLAKK